MVPAEKLALTSDYAGNRADLPGRLVAMSNSGFSDYMHCHGWNMNDLYAKDEILQVRTWARDTGLGLVDVHGTSGREHQLWSPNPQIQDQGLALVKNRMDLAEALNSNVVVLHIPAEDDPRVGGHFWQVLGRAMDDLAPRIESSGVKLAFENLSVEGDWPRNFETLIKVFETYPKELVGLCYDSGHGNVDGDGIDNLERVRDRLISVHLHGNYGQADTHDLPLEGNVDWKRLAKVIASSSYTKPLSFESSMRDSLGMGADENKFLVAIRTQGKVISGMVEDERDL